MFWLALRPTEGRLFNSVEGGLATVELLVVGGGLIKDLFCALPVVLGGRETVVELLVMGLTGNRLGDWLLLSPPAGRKAALFCPMSTEPVLPILLPVLLSDGFRSDRVRVGADMVMDWFVVTLEVLGR